MRGLYLSLALLAGAAAAPATHAQGSGTAAGTNFVAGISAGSAEYDAGNVNGFALTDDNDAAWKIFAGYQFTPNVAVEAGWVNLGKADLAGAGGKFDVGDGAYADLVGTLPLGNDVSVFGKLGAYSIESNARGREDWNSDWKYGLGANWQFHRNWGARVEWERYVDVAEEIQAGGDVDVFSVGVTYKFW